MGSCREAMLGGIPLGPAIDEVLPKDSGTTAAEPLLLYRGEPVTRMVAGSPCSRGHSACS